MTPLSDETELGAAPSEVQDLLQSAKLLLRQAGHLDALHLLHGAIQQALSDSGSGGQPPRYQSLSEARLKRPRLSAFGAVGTSPQPPAGTLREFLRRRPPWLSRALTLV